MSAVQRISYKFYWRLEQFIVPGLKNSQFYYKEKLESLICPESKWLDLGCGWHILPPWMRSSEVAERALRILEGGHEEDVFPTVYRLNTTEDINGLAEKCGFRVADLELVNSTAATAVLGPFVIPELLLIKASESASSAQSRSNIIAVLQKKASLPS